MPRSILIVDESPLVRAGLKAVLSAETDWVVCAEARAGQECLELARERRPDLVIMDLALPDCAGLELIRRLRAHLPETRILVCCLQDECLYAQRTVRAGALGFIDKRADTGQVLAAVRRVLAGKVYLSLGMVERVVEGLTGRPADHAGTVGGLTEREFEVFGLIGQGLSTAVIAARLHLSVKTVESHREKIKRKLGLGCSAELVMRAVQWNLNPT